MGKQLHHACERTIKKQKQNQARHIHVDDLAHKKKQWFH